MKCATCVYSNTYNINAMFIYWVDCFIIYFHNFFLFLKYKNDDLKLSKNIISYFRTHVLGWKLFHCFLEDMVKLSFETLFRQWKFDQSIEENIQSKNLVCINKSFDVRTWEFPLGKPSTLKHKGFLYPAFLWITWIKILSSVSFLHTMAIKIITTI